MKKLKNKKNKKNKRKSWQPSSFAKQEERKFLQRTNGGNFDRNKKI